MRRTSALVLVGLIVALIAAGCGNASVAPSGSTPAPASATPAVTVTPPPAATPAAATPAATATPRPEPTPVEFTSAAYGYRAPFPPGTLAAAPRPAAAPWDGVSTINSDGPYNDRFTRPGSKLLFVYGAPTTLGLAEYARDGQRLKHGWHGCPQTPETSTETTFAGTPALLYSFVCGGLRVFSLYVVHEGDGMVINQLTPPGSEAADQAELQELLAGWSWSD